MKRKADDFFLKLPDNATKVKIDIFKKYFGIYLKIIDNTRKNLKLNKIIKIIDLFSGPGYFIDETSGAVFDSTPIHILENCLNNNYSDLQFYFNDYNDYHIELLKEKINKTFFDLEYNIDYSTTDARNVDLDSIINNDIVVSLIDSYSYLGLDKYTINKLVSNQYSDVICYFRISNILEHIGNNNEKNNHILLFGNEEKYNEVLKIKNDKDIQQYQKVDKVVKILIENINSYGQIKYFLPFFIKYSSEDTKIESVVMIISKNLIGLEKIKDMVKDIQISEGKFYSFNDIYKGRISLFDFEKDNIIKYIGNKYINSNQLLEIINNDYITNYGYISAYSLQYIKNKLIELENKKRLNIKYLSTKKRKIGTFSEKTVFCLKVNKNG